ncbi:MAG: UDP-3-O-acyl-N-acetylglucosamine deacetylase [Rhizobiaceae bacterium]
MSKPRTSGRVQAGATGAALQDQQTTIRSGFRLTGTGVHSGKPVAVRFSPSEADTGIRFSIGSGAVRTTVRALASEVGGTDLSTVLGDPGGAHVATVEHLMAALIGVGIDNISIDVDGGEVPIFDGSAAPYVHALEEAGIALLGSPRRYIRVMRPVRVESGSSWAEFTPYDGTRFDIKIDFDSPAIGRQAITCDLTAASFRRDVARARTFGFIKDVERLWAAGLALGSSLENSVVIGDDHRIINIEGLRYPDEFVRHKLLDAVGDLSLAGARFIGRFRSYRGGHKLNLQVLRALLADASAFEIVEATRRERGRLGEMRAIAAPVYQPWAL